MATTAGPRASMAGASAGAALVALYVGGAAFAVGVSLAVGACLATSTAQKCALFASCVARRSLLALASHAWRRGRRREGDGCELRGSTFTWPSVRAAAGCVRARASAPQRRHCVGVGRREHVEPAGGDSAVGKETEPAHGVRKI